MKRFVKAAVLSVWMALTGGDSTHEEVGDVYGSAKGKEAVGIVFERAGEWSGGADVLFVHRDDFDLDALVGIDDPQEKLDVLADQFRSLALNKTEFLSEDEFQSWQHRSDFSLFLSAMVGQRNGVGPSAISLELEDDEKCIVMLGRNDHALKSYVRYGVDLDYVSGDKPSAADSLYYDLAHEVGGHCGERHGHIEREPVVRLDLSASFDMAHKEFDSDRKADWIYKLGLKRGGVQFEDMVGRHDAQRSLRMLNNMPNVYEALDGQIISSHVTNLHSVRGAEDQKTVLAPMLVKTLVDVVLGMAMVRHVQGDFPDVQGIEQVGWDVDSEEGIRSHIQGLAETGAKVSAWNSGEIFEVIRHLDRLGGFDLKNVRGVSDDLKRSVHEVVDDYLFTVEQSGYVNEAYRSDTTRQKLEAYVGDNGGEFVQPVIDAFEQGVHELGVEIQEPPRGAPTI